MVQNSESFTKLYTSALFEQQHGFDLSKFLNIQRCELDISQYIKKDRENKITYIPACQNRLVTTDLTKGDSKITIYIKFLH